MLRFAQHDKLKNNYWLLAADYWLPTTGYSLLTPDY